jgi:hypothetical protein
LKCKGFKKKKKFWHFLIFCHFQQINHFIRAITEEVPIQAVVVPQRFQDFRGELQDILQRLESDDDDEELHCRFEDRDSIVSLQSRVYESIENVKIKLPENKVMMLQWKPLNVIADKVFNRLIFTKWTDRPNS